jgi:1,2-diacylglycerol 3-alpha-glucosyltransferase
MKIVHCCLANFYIDDFGYQENIFPRIHRELGHDVEIVASTEIYIDRMKLGYTHAGKYLSKDGVPVTRLPYVKWLPAILARKLRIYKGLNAELCRFKPEIVFLHDCQFLSIITVARYIRQTGATVYVDSHTDFINSGNNFISRYILHGLVYRLCAKIIEPYAKKFYPTLPLRADFLHDVYGIAKAKIELLPFGADDSRINRAERSEIRNSIRKQLQISEDALVFIAGGKIDRRKSIHTLIECFCRLADSVKLNGAHLILFGRPEESLRQQVEAAAKHPFVRYVGWIDERDIPKYLWASDVAVFPGTHSVLWEEAVGLGVPCLFRRWPGIEHVDVGGNCLFLDDATESTIEQAILEMVNNPAQIEEMRSVASAQGPNIFSYTAIAKRAIENR